MLRIIGGQRGLRGYGVGGNAKGPAAQTRRPNKGHIGYGSGENETELDGNAKGPAAQTRRPNKGYGSGENETELDALYRALRGERELQRMRATSHDRLTAKTGEEREARLQQMSAQQRDRLASETAEERDIRLQFYSVRHREQIAVQSHCHCSNSVLFEQRC